VGGFKHSGFAACEQVKVEDEPFKEWRDGQVVKMKAAIPDSVLSSPKAEDAFRKVGIFFDKAKLTEAGKSDSDLIRLDFEHEGDQIILGWAFIFCKTDCGTIVHFGYAEASQVWKEDQHYKLNSGFWVQDQMRTSIQNWIHFEAWSMLASKMNHADVVKEELDKVECCSKCGVPYGEQKDAHNCLAGVPAEIHEEVNKVMLVFENLPAKNPTTTQLQDTFAPLLKHLQQKQFVRPLCDGHWQDNFSAHGQCQLKICTYQHPTVNNFKEGPQCSNGGHWIHWTCLLNGVNWDKSTSDIQELKEILITVNSQTWLQ